MVGDTRKYVKSDLNLKIACRSKVLLEENKFNTK